MREWIARVEAVLMTPEPKSFLTERSERLELELAGIPGDRHYGLQEPADMRQAFYPRGTLIANRRQISLVAVEELAVVAERLGVPAITPELLGANVLLSGLPELTKLPLGARLLFASGAGLICEGENEPCRGPGAAIAKHYGRKELTVAFVRAAEHLRGIVASVEREGGMAVGDEVRVMLAE